jgi:hypothetical protein
MIPKCKSEVVNRRRWQKEKEKKSNNGLQNTYWKLNIEQQEPH